MPNFAGTWKMKRSENFDDLLKALGKPSPVSFLPSLLSLSPPSMASAASLHEVDYPSCPYRKRPFLFFENGMPRLPTTSYCSGEAPWEKERRDPRGDAAEGKSLGFTRDMKHWMRNSSINRRGIVT